VRKSKRTIAIALLAAYALAVNAIVTGFGGAIAVGHAAIGLDVICADGSAPGAPIRPADHNHKQTCCTAACGHGAGVFAIDGASAWLAVRYAATVLDADPSAIIAVHASSVLPVGSRAPPWFV
jgi:hypothetical protein